MPEFSDLYTGSNHIPSDGKGALIGSHSGPAFVVCNNAAAATTNPTHVYDALDGTSTNHDDLIKWAMDFGSFIEFHHVVIASDMTSLSVTTAPKIRVFGETPVFQGRAGKNTTQRRLPQDINQDGLDITPYGLWIPLVTPSYTEGTPELELNGTAIAGDIGASGYIHVSEPKYVFRSGATKGIITVDTASVVSPTGAGGGNVTHNMIIARIHG